MKKLKNPIITRSQYLICLRDIKKSIKNKNKKAKLLIKRTRYLNLKKLIIIFLKMKQVKVKMNMSIEVLWVQLTLLRIKVNKVIRKMCQWISHLNLWIILFKRMLEVKISKEITLIKNLMLMLDIYKNLKTCLR